MPFCRHPSISLPQALPAADRPGRLQAREAINRHGVRRAGKETRTPLPPALHRRRVRGHKESPKHPPLFLFLSPWLGAIRRSVPLHRLSGGGGRARGTGEEEAAKGRGGFKGSGGGGRGFGAAGRGRGGRRGRGQPLRTPIDLAFCCPSRPRTLPGGCKPRRPRTGSGYRKLGRKPGHPSLQPCTGGG